MNFDKVVVVTTEIKSTILLKYAIVEKAINSSDGRKTLPTTDIKRKLPVKQAIQNKEVPSSLPTTILVLETLVRSKRIVFVSTSPLKQL